MNKSDAFGCLSEDKNKYSCPHCGKDFPVKYKGVKAGFNTRKGWIDDKSGLARANFNRHLDICRNMEHNKLHT